MSLDDIIRTSRSQSQSKGPLQVIKSSRPKSTQGRDGNQRSRDRPSFRGRGGQRGGRGQTRGRGRGGFLSNRNNNVRNYNNHYQKRDRRDNRNNLNNQSREGFRQRDLQQVRIQKFKSYLLRSRFLFFNPSN